MGLLRDRARAAEAIVDRRAGLELEDALRAFEAGVALTRRCAKQLSDAERRIEVLVREGESWVARPFEEPEEGE
jgi:exodeoxyribonuclease VII small subunit